MAIHVALHHLTHYTYERPAKLDPQTIRLRPAPHNRTRVHSYSLKVTPENHFINWQQDPHGNYLARIVFPERVSEFKVEVDLVTEMAIINPFDFFLEPDATHCPFTYAPELAEELKPFLVNPVDVGPAFEAYLGGIDRSRCHTIDFLVNLNQALQQHIAYGIRMEPGVQTPEVTLTRQHGSCRDTAWLLINLLRGLGLAARFASGYLIQLTPDQKSLDGPSGPEIDFTDLHAWAEVFLPGAGWVGLDPTSGLLTGEGHIPLACTPSPSSAAPISGSLEPVETKFAFDMHIQRIYEAPRVTRPFSDEAWQRLDAVGQAVDKRIQAADMRLTMGGEPTFISIDDMDGPEWNVSAVGPNKLRLSQELIQRLYHRFAPGGLLHFGQGKWYPGESLPRWAFTCYWRKDGQPIWRQPELMADVAHADQAEAMDARRFVRGLAEALEVNPKHAAAAYEDPWYYLWKEQKLPTNVDPLDNRLEDPEERARLAEVFEKGINTPRGYVLPIQRWWQAKGGKGWISSSWQRRQKRLFLIPGDSPVGLRLPLDSLPWVSAGNYPYVNAIDPTLTDGPALPDLTALLEKFRQVRQRVAVESWEDPQRQRTQRQELLEDEPELDDAGQMIVRTALCVEVRQGRIHVFMPPVSTVEDYLELVTAVEETATALQMRVVIEGEKPPHDSRLLSFSVTPDPGVIEVNIHPSSSWQELVQKTTILYDEARQSRLGTDKFMIDGRHVGTGGGNHMVVGGATPLDSPFLRRPDLLRSMVAYWLHHPSLSYLFGGLFIGPTSQSPRVDEARNDSLYELELAFRELDRCYGTPQPWLVDRIFRNLLIDATGNTHRAEFCIDKLYNPDRSSGRLGLLELRSFEMPPHARMSLAQQLLLRGLMVWLWEQPYHPRRLIRWGTQLHDRFMMPHFLWQDFCDVLADLCAAGISMEEEWFQAHFEFRFPLYGEVAYREVKMEVRHALEPWHVLGEEGVAGGTVRFVDSSVERLQLRVTGFNDQRYVVACNGRKMPLTGTGRAGEYVASVRYRAWQPPSCLHPTIGVDAPLVFDLIDTWSGRAVAGCTYHVGHPGGRSHNTFPINAYEAESRRLARFFPFGHTPGKVDRIPQETPSEDFPYTLDLRQYH